MSYTVPDSKKSIKQNRFEFVVASKEFSVPLLKFLPVSAAAAFERGDPVEGILEGCDTQSARAAILSLDGEQFDAFIHAWSEASGIELGESSASTE